MIVSAILLVIGGVGLLWDDAKTSFSTRSASDSQERSMPLTKLENSQISEILRGATLSRTPNSALSHTLEVFHKNGRYTQLQRGVAVSKIEGTYEILGDRYCITIKDRHCFFLKRDSSGKIFKQSVDETLKQRPELIFIVTGEDS